MSQRSASDFTIPGVITAAIAVIGWLSYRPPLESARPPQRGVSERFKPTTAEPLTATPYRLWDDPLITYREEIDAKRPPTKDCEIQALLKDMSDNTDSLVILPVMVPGEYIADSQEQRLRMRYAVSSALAEHDYHPVGGYSTFYTDVSLEAYAIRTNQLSPPRRQSVRVPVTLWVKNVNGGPPCYIVNVWIDESHLGMRPVDGVLQLSERLIPPRDRSATIIRIIGPAHSDTLKLMRANVKVGSTALCSLQPRIAAWKKVSVWSARATNPPQRDSSHDTEQVSDAKLFDACGIDFFPVIDTDEILTQSLIEELRLRGAMPVYDSDRLVLITESDSAYGRYWRDQSFGNLRSGESDGSHEESRLVVHTFLRGIDGYDAHGSLEGKSKNLPSSTNRVEAPRTGTSQFDYLLRVQEDIAQLKADGKRICAVGVVGSDIYDKLLVLRALRTQLPNTCFFTTDLDVELWKANELPYTRNLVVASHFGLRLSRKLQSQTPPFRDSYQTSLFYATNLAIEGVMAPAGSGASIFEIGRRGPYHLTTKSIDAHETNLPHPPSDRHRSAENAWMQWPYYVFCLAAAVGLLTVAGVQFVGKPARHVLASIVSVSNSAVRQLQSVCSIARSASTADRLGSMTLLTALILLAGYLAIEPGFWLLEKAAASWPRSLLAASPMVIAVAFACDRSHSRQEPVQRAWLWHFVAISFIIPCLILPIMPITLNWIECLCLVAFSIFGFWFLSAFAYNASPRIFVSQFAEARLAALRAGLDEAASVRADRWPTLKAIVLFSQFVVVAIVAVVALDHWREGGEPFTFSGVSLWPVTLSRAILLVIASALIYQVFEDLDRNAKSLKAKYFTTDTLTSGRWADFLSEPLLLRRQHPAMSLAWMFLTFACSLFALTDFPSLPYRGAVSKWTSLIVLYLVVLVACLLTFTVFAAISVARTHIRFLQEARKDAGEGLTHAALSFSTAASPWDQVSMTNGHFQTALSRLTCIRILGSRTRIIGKLLQYPAFILLCVLLIHLTWLDSLDLSPQLLVIVGVLVILPIAFYARLLHDADALRKAYLEDISGWILQLDMNEPVRTPEAASHSEALTRIAKGIEQEDQGAYGPLLRGPILKAMAIPLGGTGGLMLMQEVIAVLQR
jgi:hypothetical protein